MLDFSDVTRFARRLVDASETSDLESEWKRDTSRDIAGTIRPPRRTGALAASVTATDEGVKMLDYWRFLEYGTVNMSAQPFVRPAVRQETPRALSELGEKAIRELT